MNLHAPSLRKSFTILNSVFCSVVIAYLLEPSIIVSLLSEKVTGSPFWPLLFMIIFIVKICFYGGLYGILIEIVSKEEILFRRKNFKDNLRRNWPVGLTLTLLPMLFHFLIFACFPKNTISTTQILSQWDLIFAYLAALWIIKIKYLSPGNFPKRKVNISLRHASILLGFLGINIFLFYIIPVLPINPLNLSRLSLFIFRYMHFLAFLYLADVILSHYPEVLKKFEYSKELILIRPLGPGIFEAIGSVFIRSHPPVFTVLKALTPGEYRFREFNQVFWRDRYFANNKLVAITCYTSNCPEAYRIAKEFKKRGSKVIQGGPHVTYMSDEALEYCDSVVIGEAEGVWQQVVKDYENNALKPRYQGMATDETHRIVHQGLLNSPQEVIKDFLETTRGCKFKCHFCTIPALNEGKIYKKAISEVVELIEKVKKKYKHLLFIDNNIYSDPAYARELFKALKPLNIKWSTQCTIDIAKNDETLQLAKESGCEGLLFGYEIYGNSPERSRGGKYKMADHYLQYSEKIKQHGIYIKAHYIFGYDADTLKNLWTLWKFCFSLNPRFTIISLLTPLPGAVLFDELLNENRITNLNWHNYAVHSLVFRHKQMNNALLSFLYPVIVMVFIYTASQFGRLLLLVIFFVIVIF